MSKFTHHNKISSPSVDGALTLDTDVTVTGDLTVTGSVSSGGSSTEGGVVFNDAGAAVDFRVEGDTLPNLVLVDASADLVYVTDAATGGTPPTAPTGGFTAGTLLAVQNNSAATDNAIVALVGGATSGLCGIDAGDTGDSNIGSVLYDHAADDWTVTAGTVPNLTVAAGGVTVNEGAADVDFTVATDTNTGTIFVEGSSDLVSVGGATPTAPAAQLHVIQDSTTGAVPCIELDQDDTDQPFIEFDGASAGDLTANITTLTTESVVGHVRVSINGTDRWIAFSDTPS